MISNTKAFILGTYHGLPRKYLQSYFNCLALAQAVVSKGTSGIFTFDLTKDGGGCLTCSTDKTDAYNAGRLDAYLTLVDLGRMELHDVPQYTDMRYEDVVQAYRNWCEAGKSKL